MTSDCYVVPSTYTEKKVKKSTQGNVYATLFSMQNAKPKRQCKKKGKKKTSLKNTNENN